MRGRAWASPRGLGDFRVQRELLDASPRQQTSEMLSAAPGFFVDHEDGEGFGNDVYLRGFDLDHGSGIEMRVGSVPINNPLHIQGQGYADANFIIPEVVRSIRVLEGPFDPRQGDAAIVGSAYFDLGVPRTRLPARRQLRIVRPSAAGRDRRAPRSRRGHVRGVLASQDERIRREPRWPFGLGERAIRRRSGASRSDANPGDGLRRALGVRRRRPCRTTSTPAASASTTRIRTTPRARALDLRA